MKKKNPAPTRPDRRRPPQRRHHRASALPRRFLCRPELALLFFYRCSPTSIRQDHEFLDGWCKAEHQDDTIHVESRLEFQWRRNRWGGDAARAGEYEFTHGGESKPFKVPSEDNLDCDYVLNRIGDH